MHSVGSVPVVLREGHRPLVYFLNQPDWALTRLYVELQHGFSNNKDSWECIRLFAKLRMYKSDLDISSEREDVRQVVEKFLSEEYGLKILRRSQYVKLHTTDRVSLNTIRTVLSRIKKVFDVALECGWRKNNPLDQNVTKTYVRGREEHRATWYFQLDKSLIRSPDVLDYPELPMFLREAATRAGWAVRDHVILELLLCSGARRAEVCTLTWAGISVASDTLRIAARNKGHRDAIVKDLTVSPEAESALVTYLTGERARHDPLTEAYTDWRRRHKRPLHPLGAYLAFLIATGRDLNKVPLFLTTRGHPYSANTFSRGAWANLNVQQRRYEQRHPTSRPLVRKIHHIRHWYINQELDRTYSHFGTRMADFLPALDHFVSRMGWKVWTSIEAYDHRGHAVRALKVAERRITTVDHGITTDMALRAEMSGISLEEAACSP